MRASGLPLLVLLLGAPVARAGEVRISPGLECLVEAYPARVCGASATALRWCDGSEMPWTDGSPRATLAESLAHPDLRSQMAQRYPAGRGHPEPALDFEPGRVRYEPFFEKMYGATRAAVRRKLGPVRWLSRHGGRILYATRVNGVDRALQAVSDDLDRMPARLRDMVREVSGTFVWRKVKGSTRRSAHSFGIAIDVAVRHSDYWRWRRPRAGGRLRYRNRIPMEIVEVFERHGFIWGGRWYHFDTMHFEYRPELLTRRCALRLRGR